MHGRQGMTHKKHTECWLCHYSKNHHQEFPSQRGSQSPDSSSCFLQSGDSRRSSTLQGRPVRPTHCAARLANTGAEDALTDVLRSKQMFTAHSSSLSTTWKFPQSCASPPRPQRTSFVLLATVSSPRAGWGKAFFGGLW